MPTAIEKVREDFDAREDRLEVFDRFSGTGELGETDAPEPGEEVPNRPAWDTVALGAGTAASGGLTFLSYKVHNRTNPAEPFREALTLFQEKIHLGNLREKAQDGKDIMQAVKAGKSTTELMELLPYVGVNVRRMNIDAVWDEIEDILKIMQLNLDRARLAIEPVDDTMDTLHSVSGKAFYAFAGLSALGAAATVISAKFHDRAMPLVEDAEDDAGALDGRAARKVEKAFAEFEFRTSVALGDLDAKLVQVDRLVGDLPDPRDLAKVFADVDALVAPIDKLKANIGDLIKPFEEFLGAAEVIGAPIEGVLKLFENPPKVLPTIVGYKTITPGFWLTVPDPTLTNPFRTKEVWVPPVKAPIPGFKELFDPIPRDEVQKIIDLLLKIAGTPQKLLETALAPILEPLQAQIDKLLRPVLDKLNPFDDHLDAFKLIGESIEAIRDKLTEAVADIRAAVNKVAAIVPDLDPVEEIGKVDPTGMATFFGSDAAETIVGRPPDKDGGFMKGAMLQGNGGEDTIIGTKMGDLLGGGAGNDEIRAKGGADVVLGGGGNDYLNGGGGGDVILGGGGRDRMVGGGGKDEMHGGGGRDKMSGGNGRDEIHGGKGQDIMRGGADADFFHFDNIGDTSRNLKNSDLIADFEKNTDHVVLRDMDASTVLRGDNDFEWNGKKRGFGEDPDGEIYFKHVDRPGAKNDLTLVYLDTDADAKHEGIIRMAGIIDLDKGDFIL